jgi:phosphotransferase system HPr (HPr) family protein
MIETRITVTHKAGLHARPAALFVQTANKFSSSVKIRNLTTNGMAVDAKSIIMVLTVGVMKDHQILIQADGTDEGSAIESLKSLVENNFGEA